ncbi:MAG: esterase family protein [Actinobacteria bacterium]|nr:esterase family protein [Actinomycetota bacterium]
MRRLLTIFAVLAALLAPAAGRAADYVCAPPRCVDVDIPHDPDAVHVSQAHVRVLLPANYATSGLSYPVLYLLHGVGDPYTRWTENTDVDAFTQAMNLIVVMPDGGHGSDAGWYSDWVDGTWQWETFHISTVVPYIDSHYRTLRDEHRAIAGLSMGGFGAMSYAARHAGLFKVAASFSGAVDINYAFPLTGAFFNLLHQQYGTPTDGVWGNQITAQDNWKKHNPTDLAADLGGTKLFLATGTGTPAGPQGDDYANLGGYGLEHFIWQMNLSLVRALDAQNVPHTDWFYTGGQHTWPYWQADLHWLFGQGLLNDIG